MANAFQNMLQQFRLTEKIHAINADNVASNDTQITKLDKLDNTFDKENQVWCFNHTLQLSAKALLKPFNVGLSGNATDDDDKVAQDNDDNPVIFEDDRDKGDDEDEEELADDVDDKDDNIDELGELSKDEQNQVLEETVVVRETITKVSIPNAKRKMFA